MQTAEVLRSAYFFISLMLFIVVGHGDGVVPSICQFLIDELVWRDFPVTRSCRIRVTIPPPMRITDCYKSPITSIGSTAICPPCATRAASRRLPPTDAQLPTLSATLMQVPSCGRSMLLGSPTHADHPWSGFCADMDGIWAVLFFSL